MSNHLVLMNEIRRLMAIWITEVRLNSYESYTDINKAGEGLARQLLNLMYGYHLLDLNLQSANFPGLDIGDASSGMVAYQVTSRTDRKKVIENLQTVVEKKFHEKFINGIRFLILNDTDKVSFGPNARKRPELILSSFNMSTDIIYPQDLIKKIADIYEQEGDLQKFFAIKALLEKELIPLVAKKQEIDVAKENEHLKDLLKTAIEKINAVQEKPVAVSAAFFYSSMVLPQVHILGQRTTLVAALQTEVIGHDVVWLSGGLSAGKTSLALLTARRLAGGVYWLDCRDIKKDQLIEQLLQTLTVHLGVPLQKDYHQTLGAIFTGLNAGDTIVINDIPDLAGAETIQDRLGLLLAAANSKGINLLVTSNFAVPIGLADKFALDILPLTAMPFSKEDTLEVFQSLGAPTEFAQMIADYITNLTQGHPLLIHSAANYLKQINWQLTDNTLIEMYRSGFGTDVQQETYKKVLAGTADDATRELLYRLRYAIGIFDTTNIRSLAAIEPLIDHPVEKMQAVKGVWLEELAPGKFQLSPLIKTLDGNTTPATEKQIYHRLAEDILSQKNISQRQAFVAIFYFFQSGHVQDAALILYQAIGSVITDPEQFFETGFNLFWWDEPIAPAVSPFLKVQIRMLQVTIAQKTAKDTRFLLSDLQQVIALEDPGTLSYAAANMLLYTVKTLSDPIAAFRHLAAAQASFGKVTEELGEDIFNPELINGVWILFFSIYRKQDYEAWFSIYPAIHLPPGIKDAARNPMYMSAGSSIYRTAVLKNKDDGTDIASLLHWLMTSCIQYDLLLIAAYALKYLVKYLAEDKKDWAAIDTLVKEQQTLITADPLYQFLVYGELGMHYFLNNERVKANQYFNPLRDIVVPDMYAEQLDYLVSFMQSVYPEEPHFAGTLTQRALTVVLSGLFFLPSDKISLYGEAAIAAIREKDYTRGLDLYAEGFELLLRHFTGTEQDHALVLRYGNAIKYVKELLDKNGTPSFGSGKNIIPETGYFYRTHGDLLTENKYFEERKFMNAHFIQSCYESSGDFENAKKWAYKSFELSRDLEAPNFIVAVQASLFYLVDDRQIKQAYNMQAFIEKFYRRMITEPPSEKKDYEAVEENLRSAEGSDMGMYFFVLLPVTLSISIDLLTSSIRPEQFAMMIEDAFSNSQYEPKDAAGYAQAKQLFEKIIIERISYHDMNTFLEGYSGNRRDILYLLGCVLLSSFASPKDAGNLQLAVVMLIDKMFGQAKAMYQFCIVPYFIKFWKLQILRYPGSFTGKELLRTKGFELVGKVRLENKIKTLFRVLADHLDITISGTAETFIDSTTE